MANATNLSAYQIFWIEFRATSGIVTKKDIRVLSKSPISDCKYASGNKNLLQHFATKQAALDYIETVKANQYRLGKKYEVRICSDRQFGLSKKEGNFFVIPFTAKQENEMFTIG